jgi:hypothetical protein
MIGTLSRRLARYLRTAASTAAVSIVMPGPIVEQSVMLRR